MKCPVCVENGLVSKLYADGFSTSTAMGGSQRFYDEDGVGHYHDVNVKSTGYRCSNGHIVTLSGRPDCPALDCDYGSMTWTVNEEVPDA